MDGFHLAIAFCVALAGFLAGCLVAAFLTEPDDDEAPDDGGLGDCYLAQELRRHASGPHPDHIESRVHHGRKEYP